MQRDYRSDRCFTSKYGGCDGADLGFLGFDFGSFAFFGFPAFEVAAFSSAGSAGAGSAIGSLDTATSSVGAMEEKERGFRVFGNEIRDLEEEKIEENR